MVAQDKSLCVTGYMQLKRIPTVEVKVVRLKELGSDGASLVHKDEFPNAPGGGGRCDLPVGFWRMA